jgi:hypothetical protein
MTTIKTKVKYYRFDISNEEEKKQYKALSQKLNKLGLTLFDSISLSDYTTKTSFFNKIKELENKGFIELETEFIFNNQWNTTEESFNLRVFDWAEEIYPNRKIKEGYYLEVNKEMTDIRENTFKCGYCGKQYFKTKERFCLNCLDSEYLTKDNLILLQLKKVSDERDFKPLSLEDETYLNNLYTKAQINGNSERGKKRIEDLKIKLLEDKTKTIKNAETEYKGFMWLINKGINTNNVIYYNHTNIFCFGWKQNLSFEIEQELKQKLKNFPFKYELKV